MKCPQCDASVSDEHRFCQRCGANLDPALGVVREFVATRLRKEVQNALKSETKDQKLVEIETAQAVVFRLTEWAKLFGFLIGIPVAIIVALLAFFGFKTYSDISKVADGAKDVIQSKVEAITEKADGISKTADQIKSEVDELAKKRDELRVEQGKLADQLTSIGQQLASLQDDVTKQLNDVRTDFNKLEKRLLRFESSSALTPEIEKNLATLATKYHAYLTDVGFDLEGEPVNVRVDPDLLNNSYYSLSSNQLVLGPLWAEDPDVFLREYNHHALASQVGGTFDFAYVEFALADYFACSFQDDPALGEIIVAKLGKAQGHYFSDKEHIRHLANNLKFNDVPDTLHSKGEVLGGVFWDIRQLIGQDETDRLLLSGWVSFNVSRSSGDEIVNFASILLKKAATIDQGKHVNAIRAMFKARGLDV